MKPSLSKYRQTKLHVNLEQSNRHFNFEQKETYVQCHRSGRMNRDCADQGNHMKSGEISLSNQQPDDETVGILQREVQASSSKQWEMITDYTGE